MTDRRFWLSVLAIWLVTSIVLTAVTWHAIISWRFPDPDDQMRLLEVRDWLNGQSWFDLTQHRLNEPAGVPMHWSRLVDLPIAAVILLARPILGQLGAEHVALVVVPLLTLGAVMALLAALARRLLAQDEPSLIAVCIPPLCIEVLHQLLPMRIDHHGWQTALALLAAYALVGNQGKRAGLLTGMVIATWLSISLEGLPMVAAILALAAIRWAIIPAKRPLLVATMAATTVGTAIIYAASHPASSWSGSVCDAVSPVYLAMLALATLGTIALTALPIRSMIGRLAGLAVVGAASLGPIPLIAPQCAAGPFGHLDPLVHKMWYLNVMEGLPLWVQSPATIANTIALPLVGLAGTALAVRTSDGEARQRWVVMLFLLGAATLAAVATQRAGGVANLLAIPGAVSLLFPLLVRARALRNVPKRIAGTLGIAALAAPGMAASTLIGSVDRDPGVAEVHRAMGCLDATDMAALNVLPAGDVLAPLDISPTILLLTRQGAVASGHHRGAAAMHDVIAAFTGSDAQARAIVTRRRLDYVAFCPGLPEIMIYEGAAKNGFMAHLDAGRAPNWLAPIAIAGSPVKVWRVR